MNKIVIHLLVLVIAVVGCSSGNTQSQSPPEQPSPTGQKTIVNWEKIEVERVVISRSQRVGSVYPAVLGTITEPDALKIFVDSFSTAEKLLGKLDIGKPDYDLIFSIDGSQHSFHLWLDHKNDNGLYMYVSDTSTGYKLTEEAASKLRRFINQLPYPPEQAENNGDVVNLHGRISNLDRWNQFLKDVAKGTPTEVHVTSYTIEGGAIFQDLNYDGTAIEYSFDNTKDAFGTPMRTIAYCKGITQSKVEHGTQYTLAQCDQDEQSFSFTVEMEND